ncbi:MAG: HEAT repeat domain-containing protein [Candidatus Hydrogenedentes bacterium]|nr:HEAT repeat domain-containing protein [Candidatus Hydrogenedentota bacterium]
MPKKDPSQDGLRELRAMEADDPSPEGIAKLHTLIAHRSNHVVGRAARLAGLWQAESLIPELITAFRRFLQDPVKTDPGCAAKQPIIEALDLLGNGDASVYFEAVRHIQREPAFGPPIDTAASVRGAGGHALLNLRHPDAWLVMAALLNDREHPTRRMAVESLGLSETHEAELLLRMKVHGGDEEPDISSLALQSLMKCAPDRSLDFVKRYLRGDEPDMLSGAAMAIGEARLPDSFAILRAAMEGPGARHHRYAFYLPLALTREPEAFEVLLEALREERRHEALAAVKALAVFFGDPERVARVEAVVSARGERDLVELFERLRDGDA